MRVNVRPKLLRIPSVYKLSDLHLVKRDLTIARNDFGATIGQHRVVDSSGHHQAYSLCCSGLIHYRRAFATGIRTAKLSEEIVSSVASELLEHHRYLWYLANRYVAHSYNEFEQLAVTISVAEDDEGNVVARSLGLNALSAGLLSENQVQQSLTLIGILIAAYLEPEMDRLEGVIKQEIAKLSADELKALPDGFPPNGNFDPRTKRSWPHSGR